MGMIVAGAVPLLLATAYGWNFSYAVMAALMTVGVAAVLAAPPEERHAIRYEEDRQAAVRIVDDIVEETGVLPAVNQIELHPYFPQEEMRAVNAHKDIRTMAWSPLGKRNAPYTEPAVESAAQEHGVTPAQVILRWHLQLGNLPIPKAASLFG